MSPTPGTPRDGYLAVLREFVRPWQIKSFGELDIMYCWTHRVFYTFGECPKCADAQVRAYTCAQGATLTNQWAYLKGHPDEINQDRFGVCGMTSVVYLLLQHDQAKADDLFNATFADIIPAHAGTRFTTAGSTNPH